MRFLDSPPDPSAPDRLPILDGARGVAALVVVIGHCANAGLLPAALGYGSGHMAVMLFFALSGFLMAYLYADRDFTGAAGEYARNRIGRVVPLYVLIVLISIAGQSAPVWLFPIDSGAEAARHLFFIFGTFTLWTIPVEIQFYFLFLLVWLGHAQGKALSTILALVAAQALLAVTFQIFELPHSTLPFWGHFFLFGTLCGLLWRRNPGLGERIRHGRLLGWSIIVLAVLSLPDLRRMAGIPLLPSWMDPLTAGSPTLLFVACLLGLGPLRALGQWWGRELGKISYGVYLIHFPVLMTLKDLPLPGIAVAGLVVAVTIVLAELSFEYFERPMRTLIARRARRRSPA